MSLNPELIHNDIIHNHLDRLRQFSKIVMSLV